MTDWPQDDLLAVESGGPSGIFLLRLEGDSATLSPYYTPDADVDDAQVSPDGTLAAYVSDESGEGGSADQIYVRSFPEPRAETLVSEDGGRWPFWSADGGTLFYYCGREARMLCAADVARQPTAMVTARRVVMEWPYDFVSSLHPDGDRLIATRPAETEPRTDEAAVIAPERQILVHNWFGELRRIFASDGR